jgi:hypothetical protein
VVSDKKIKSDNTNTKFTILYLIKNNSEEDCKDINGLTPLRFAESQKVKNINELKSFNFRGKIFLIKYWWKIAFMASFIGIILYKKFSKKVLGYFWK